jgi:hypothetical protein
MDRRDLAAFENPGIFTSTWVIRMRFKAGLMRTKMSTQLEVEGFDEAWYTKFYADVGEAVAAGNIRSGFDHYVSFGRKEGRSPSPSFGHFDEDWYFAAYPMARADLEAGRAVDCHDHWVKFGRARGYLPNRFAKRPADPTAPASRFGGSWPDRGNALDLVEGRREIGTITELQAEQLKHWIERGYIVLSNVFPRDVLDRAEEELDRAYRGEIAELLFSAPSVGSGEISWSERIPQHSAKALDLHWLSAAIRDLIFAPGLRHFLELIFERRILASQSLTFLRGSAQPPHLDSLYVPFSLPMEFVASWISLEDVTVGAGELLYFVGSHKLPEQVLAGEYKNVWEVLRVTGSNNHHGPAAEYEAQLPHLAKAHGMAQETFAAKRGDVLIWHAGLVHGGMPISQEHTRKSVVTHYCPREVAPLPFERRSPPWQSYRDQAYYTTGYYGMEQHR